MTAPALIWLTLAGLALVQEVTHLVQAVAR
jgi:hypothetical protein